ncbi:MAG: serine hydrolase [Patescibacteria group bacterium]|jgi:D-alanyl-D-alanine carboxypeptidase
MFLSIAFTLAFVFSTALLNTSLDYSRVLPDFFGYRQEEGSQILGMVENARDASLSFLGYKKLPVSEDKPAPPVIRNKVAGLKIAARSAVAVDCQSNNIIFKQAAEEKWPIASITKLMTALVFLDYNPGWEKEYQMKKGDRREGGKVFLFPGEKIKIKDLFYTSLVASDNTATAALVHSTGMTEGQFVEKMRERANLLGMVNTAFFDSTGLKPNESTAEEIAKFARIALENEEIQKATLTRNYRYKTLDGKEKNIPSTDQLLKEEMGEGIKMAGGKTGFTNEAGYCFVGRFSHDGHELVTVVLGTPSIDTRFTETGNLVKWIFSNFRWGDEIAPDGEK